MIVSCPTKVWYCNKNDDYASQWEALAIVAVDLGGSWVSVSVSQDSQDSGLRAQDSGTSDNSPVVLRTDVGKSTGWLYG